MGNSLRPIFSLLWPLRAEGVMRTMTTEKLLKGMPVLQTQIDTLLEFDVSQTSLHSSGTRRRTFSGAFTVFLCPHRFIPRS